jgi:type I restriction enzyme S subunit
MNKALLNKTAKEKWRPVKFCECMKLEYGDSLPEEKRIKGHVPVYGSNGIVGFHNRSLVKGPGVIVGRKGTIGAVHFEHGEFFPIDTTYYLSHNGEIDIKYAYYKMQTLQLNRLNSASGTPGLNRNDVYRINFQLPPKLEQSKISEILTTCDNVIAQTDAKIAKLKKIKQGLMQDLFRFGIDDHGQIRSETTHKFKDSPLGRIPEEWQLKFLDQLSTLITNGFVGVATPHYSNASNGVPYLYGNNIRANYVDLNNVTYVTKSFHKRHKKSQLFPGDMLTVQSGHIGTTAIVPQNLLEANCHALIFTKFKKNIVDSRFVSLYCNLCLENGKMSHLFIGSTIKHINTTDFFKFLIPFPTKQEQVLIADKIEMFDQQILYEKFKLNKLRLLRSGLMEDLLSGKVRVSHLLKNDEGE